MQKILFLSLYDQNAHIHFEASIISMYVEAYPYSEFVFFWNANHIDAVLANIPSTCKITKMPCRARLAIFLSFFYFFKTYFFKNVYRVDLTGFLSSPLYLFSGLMQNEIFLHVPWWHDARFIRILSGFINFNLTTLLRPNVRFIVLWKWILENYLAHNSLLSYQKPHFLYIDHPYLVPIKNVWRKVKGLTFCLFWIYRRHKKDNLGNDIIKYIDSVGGRVLWEADKFLSQRKYYSTLGRSTYVILPYLQAYDYICSGILIEAIVYHTPIICLKSSISQYFFRKYGSIWYECSSIEDVYALINFLISNNNSDTTNSYTIFLRNLKRAAIDITNKYERAEQYLLNLKEDNKI